MIYLAQFFAALFAFLVITKTLVDYKKGRESRVMFLFWLLTWSIVLVVAFFPNFVNILINRFGLGKTGLGTIYGLGLVFVLFVLYRIYLKTNGVERDLNKLIRELALSKKDFTDN